MCWVQELLGQVDQYKLTIQQLQEQLQALSALKQQSSTSAREMTAAAPLAEPVKPDIAQAAAAAKDDALPEQIAPNDGKIAAISLGDQVRSTCLPDHLQQNSQY